jgi:hypothetical protein
MTKRIEKIICKCGEVYLRDAEIMKAKVGYLEMDQPLNFVIIKKFKCQKCGEEKNYKINIINSN